MKGVVMTVQVNYLNPFTTPGQLVTIMVRPVPTPEGLSEGDAVIELLKHPAKIFGEQQAENPVDARCRRMAWEDLDNALDQLRHWHISVTYIRHLLHLAGHFAHRHGLVRSGSAVLTRFVHENVVSLQYDMPIAVTHAEAQAWTTAFWGELSYVDLLQPGFLFAFVDDCETPSQGVNDGHR